jgi:hypothetical protein
MTSEDLRADSWDAFGVGDMSDSKPNPDGYYDDEPVNAGEIDATLPPAPVNLRCMRDGYLGIGVGYGTSVAFFGIEAEYAALTIGKQTVGSGFLGLGPGNKSFGFALGVRAFHPVQSFNLLPVMDSYVYGEFALATPVATVRTTDGSQEDDVFGAEISVGVRSFFYNRLALSLSFGLAMGSVPSGYGDESGFGVFPAFGLTINALVR